MTKRKKVSSEDIKVDFGLGGLFKGLESLLELAVKTAKTEESEFREEKVETIRRPGGKETKAVYGVSVRMGLGGKPQVETFGNVREEIEGKAPVIDEVREPMVDILDEAKHIAIIAEMPGVAKNDIHYTIEEDLLTLEASTEDRSYYKEVLLPSPVDKEHADVSFKNGILELKLWKPAKT